MNQLKEETTIRLAAKLTPIEYDTAKWILSSPLVAELQEIAEDYSLCNHHDATPFQAWYRDYFSDKYIDSKKVGEAVWEELIVYKPVENSINSLLNKKFLSTTNENSL